MFTAWFAAEAGWRHNRLHLILAALAVVLLVGAPSLLAALIAIAAVGSLVARIVLWDVRRVQARLVPLRVPRQGRR